MGKSSKADTQPRKKDVDAPKPTQLATRTTQTKISVAPIPNEVIPTYPTQADYKRKINGKSISDVMEEAIAKLPKFDF